MPDPTARSTGDVEYSVLLDEAPAGDHPDRRRLGFVVIALTAIAVAVVSAGRGHTVSGAAVVPPPPQAGDCVSISATDSIWQQMSAEDVPVLVSAPCTGARAGEVVSVGDRRVYTQTDCGTPTARYLGLPENPTEAAGSETVWFIRSLVVSYTFGPSPLQVAPGQHWSACVALGVDPVNFRSQQLTESPRNAATRGGAAFDPFAFCSQSPLSNTTTPCSRAHRYEILADGVNMSVREADSLASCRTTVTRLTGLVDPSAGGRLRVELVTYVWNDGAPSARPTDYQQARSAGGSMMCAVSPTAPGQVLTSTLVGLGSRELPLG